MAPAQGNRSRYLSLKSTISFLDLEMATKEHVTSPGAFAPSLSRQRYNAFHSRVLPGKCRQQHSDEIILYLPGKLELDMQR